MVLGLVHAHRVGFGVANRLANLDGLLANRFAADQLANHAGLGFRNALGHFFHFCDRALYRYLAGRPATYHAGFDAWFALAGYSFAFTALAFRRNEHFFMAGAQVAQGHFQA